jgi:hypothetical protein
MNVCVSLETATHIADAIERTVEERGRAEYARGFEDGVEAGGP